MIKRKLFAYDFDGTLTNNDTFVDIIKFYKGSTGLILGMMCHMHYIVLMKLKLFPNWKTKQIIFSFFFKGLTIEEFDNICLEYAKRKFEKIVRTDALEHIKKINILYPDQSLIVSASILNWIKPFSDRFGIKTVLATEIEVRDGVITGYFTNRNCYGEEKVLRLKSHLKEARENYFITAYGDSSGDSEMLRYADSGHFNYFNG